MSLEIRLDFLSVFFSIFLSDFLLDFFFFLADRSLEIRLDFLSIFFSIFLSVFLLDFFLLDFFLCLAADSVCVLATPLVGCAASVGRVVTARKPSAATEAIILRMLLSSYSIRMAGADGRFIRLRVAMNSDFCPPVQAQLITASQFRRQLRNREKPLFFRWLTSIQV